MELISIRPGDVRGGGNIVSPAKTLQDFDVSDSVLTSVSDTVDGKTVSVFNMGYRGGAYFTVSGTPFVVYDDELTSLSVSVVLKKRSDDTVITSSSVSCIVNEETTLTETTDSNGEAEFTILYDGTVNRFNLHFKYDGTNSIGACSSHYVIIIGTITDIDLFSTQQIIATTETCQLVAEVTGHVGEDTTPVPLPYCPVSFYEEYTPVLSVSAEPGIIASGETSTLTAVLKDSLDGSRVPGETVGIYEVLDYTPVATDIELSADKSVISKYDNEKSVLTATVVDQHGVHMGSGLSVTLKKNGNTVDTLSTDDSGQVSYEYNSNGDGDVVFTAECGLLQETYSVEDCYFYDSLTSDRSLFTYVQGTATMQYSSNGLKYTGTQNTDCIHKLTCELPDGSYTLECDVTDITTNGYSTSIGTEDAMILRSSYGYYARKISTSGDFFNNKQHTTPIHLKIEFTGTTSKTIKYYIDDVLQGTGSNVLRNKQFVFRSYTNRMIQIKDLKIKPL